MARRDRSLVMIRWSSLVGLTIIGIALHTCPPKRTRDHALANAAFTSYVGLRNFRDFKLDVEADSVEPNVRVGLWAKVSGH